jgi:hypothetical protein
MDVVPSNMTIIWVETGTSGLTLLLLATKDSSSETVSTLIGVGVVKVLSVLEVVAGSSVIMSKPGMAAPNASKCPSSRDGRIKNPAPQSQSLKNAHQDRGLRKPDQLTIMVPRERKVVEILTGVVVCVMISIENHGEVSGPWGRHFLQGVHENELVGRESLAMIGMIPIHGNWNFCLCKTGWVLKECLVEHEDSDTRGLVKL